MLELRGQRPVARHRRPAVVQHLHIGTAAVDHRLYGEEHARLQHDAGARPPDMDDVGRIVEHAAKPVPAEIAHHAVAVLRSEEHTSELQSLMRNSYAVFCLKKKKTTHNKTEKTYKQTHDRDT